MRVCTCDALVMRSRLDHGSRRAWVSSRGAVAVATRGGTRELLAVLQQPRGGAASAGVAAALRAVKAVARYKQAKQGLRRQGAGEVVMRLMAARVEAAGASDGTEDATGSGDGDDSGEHAAGSGGQSGQATAD